MDRLINHAMTTIIGSFMILMSMFCVYKDILTPTEVSGWITLGIALLRAKDTIIGIKNKK